MVIPNRQCENHSLLEGTVHTSETALGRERVGITKDGFLSSAECVIDGVANRDSGDVGVGVLEDLSVLDINTADLCERTSRSVVVGDELGDNGELLGGIDCLSSTEEGLVTHAPGVEITTVLVANTIVPRIIVTTISSRTAGLTIDCARMGSISGSIGVGLPDIHFSTACSVLSGSSVGVVGIPIPAKDVGL